MSEPIHLAAPPSLSARPLIHGLEGRGDVRLRSEPWQALAAILKSGQADAVLLPSIDYPRLAADVERSRAAAGAGQPAPRHFVVLPVAAVTSRGAVGALRLFGRTERDKLRRVLLDPASPTGSALARLIVLRQFGVTPHFVMPDEIGPSPSRPPDAELVAGDRALTADLPGVLWDEDLGAEWHRMTRRPMVYAFWAARADGPIDRLRAILSEAAAAGLEAREAIAQAAAAGGKVPLEVLQRFLFEQTRYTFGLKEQQGLSAFLEAAAAEGLTPEGVKVRLAWNPAA
jgi:predicted solute-binding protein